MNTISSNTSNSSSSKITSSNSAANSPTKSHSDAPIKMKTSSPDLPKKYISLIAVLVTLITAGLAVTGFLLMTRDKDQNNQEETTQQESDQDDSQDQDSDEDSSNESDSDSQEDTEDSESESNSDTNQDPPPSDPNDNPDDDSPNNDPPKDDPPSEDPYAGWNTYTNSRYGYSIKYPNDWSVKVYDQQSCPDTTPPTTGCTNVDHKGDLVELTKERGRGFAIIVDNDASPNQGPSCSNVSLGKPITIDGTTLITFYSNGAIHQVAKNYEEEILGGQPHICPYDYWEKGGNIYYIGGFQTTSPQSDDNATIIKMLISMKF